MDLSSLHQPYSHRTRFKVVRSTKKLVPLLKPITASPQKISTQFKIVRKPQVSVKPSPIKPKLSIVKSISNKYKWNRTNTKKNETNSFKLDRRIVTNGRIQKRKPSAALSKCLIRIRGVKFQSNPNGKCLQRLASDSETIKIPPMKKIEHPTRTRANLLLQRSIQIKNGRYRLQNVKKKSLSIKKTKNCIYFNRFGKCHRGDQCPFIHDRSRIAVCTQFLHGRCKNTSCPYSHEITPGKVPTCSYFIKGACGQDHCPYAHSYVGHDAKVCEEFLQGFCSRGTECSKQHVLLCPQFETTGQCDRGKKCHLTHRRKRQETGLTKKKSDPIKTEKPSSISTSVMPAFIPFSQETEKKVPQVELKSKPSFLS